MHHKEIKYRFEGRKIIIAKEKYRVVSRMNYEFTANFYVFVTSVSFLKILQTKLKEAYILTSAVSYLKKNKKK